MKECYYAKVVDNNDTTLQAGRVKIRIEHLHMNVDDELLPWAKQMSLFSGGSASYGKSNIPEIGSWVWVMFDNDLDLLKPFYIADVHLNGMNPHLLFANNVASKVSKVTSKYPDIKFNYYANGICVGVSSNADTPEMFFYHPSGTQGTIDKSGNITVKDFSNNQIATTASGIDIKDVNNNEITMTSTGISLVGTGVQGTIDNMVLGLKLQTVLNSLITAIGAITVTCTAPGDPSSVPINAAAFTAIAGQLSTILSQYNKTN